MNATKQSILAVQAPGEYEGAIVWWGLTDALVSEADFRRRWIEAGLPEDVLPGSRSSHRNLTDAVTLAMNGVEGFVVADIVRAGAHGDTTKLAILSRSVDATTDTVVDQQESVITLVTRPDPNGGPGTTVAATAGSNPHPLADRILAEFSRLEGQYTASEIRRAIVNALHRVSAVILREHGGVYWVAPVHTTTVEALHRVINATGQSEFDVLPLYRTGLTTATVSKAAARSLADEILALQDEIAEFEKEAPRGGVLVRRLQQFEDLRGRARLYQGALGLDITALDRSVSALEATVDLLIRGPQQGAA